jgi:hypothetical protein
MTIDGVSQSTGAERLVEIETEGSGVRVVIREGDTELARVLLPADPLMSVLTDRPDGLQAVVGEEKRVLEIEIRRNEVLLAVGTADAAVGLDDLTDALASAIPPE